MTRLLLGLLISISSIPSLQQQRDPGSLMIGGVRAPEVLFETKPAYTVEAFKNRVEGTVVLLGFVRQDGSFELYRVLRGLGFGLDEQAVLAVRSWRFRPGTKDGTAVDMLHTIEVSFKRSDAREKLVRPSISDWMKQFVAEAKQAGLEGLIEAEITITPAGTLTDVNVVKDTDVALTAFLMAAARRAKLAPATLNGVPFETNAKIHYGVPQ